MAKVLVDCPFCGEDGFDLIGLKHHLTRPEDYCEAYDTTPSLAVWRRQSQIASMAGSAEDGDAANRMPSEDPERAEEAHNPHGDLQ